MPAIRLDDSIAWHIVRLEKLQGSIYDGILTWTYHDEPGKIRNPFLNEFDLVVLPPADSFAILMNVDRKGQRANYCYLDTKKSEAMELDKLVWIDDEGFIDADELM